MISLVIFRQNLRLTDNPTLALAAQANHPVVPLVLINKNDWQRTGFQYESMGRLRQQFFYDCLAGLNNNLKKRQSSLWVSKDPLETTLNNVNDAVGIAQIITTREVGFYEAHFDRQLESYGEKRHIPITFIWDNTLIHPDDLPFHMVETPNSFSSFRKKIEKKPVNLPPEVKDDCVFYTGPNNYPAAMIGGFDDKKSLLGEKGAWQHLNDYIWDSKAILHYKETRNLSIGQHVSTKFSIWLSMGVLSARQILREVRKFEKEVKKNTSTYWVFFELLWRDFFHFQCVKHGRKWYEYNGLLNQNEPVPKYDSDCFSQWVNGETAEPFVNAHMKELRATGYMSNRGRQVVASYLIHNLKQDWRRGAEVFEHFLIDYDVASNNGNWMYIAGVGNSHTKRIFNIQNQEKKYDPGNEYVKKWL